VRGAAELSLERSSAELAPFRAGTRPEKEQDGHNLTER